MKRIVTIIAFAAMITLLISCKKKEVRVVMETTKGNIELKLYDATPLHRDNFKMLVEEGAYDSLLFHRVIRDFMIQGGDPDSKHAENGQLLGEGDRPYTIPAEFRLDEGIFHRRGVLAAARESDDVNPEQCSSAMQFYIVWGKVFVVNLEKIYFSIFNKLIDIRYRYSLKFHHVALSSNVVKEFFQTSIFGRLCPLKTKVFIFKPVLLIFVEEVFVTINQLCEIISNLRIRDNDFPFMV